MKRTRNTIAVLIYLSIFVIIAILQNGCAPKNVEEYNANKALIKEKREQQRIEREQNATKIISAKEAPIENKFSGVDFLIGEGSITKSQTVYYFISTDGYSVQVDMKTYATHKIGDSFKSYNWN